jgi:Fe-S cluster assembly iron-binding protein IscA
MPPIMGLMKIPTLHISQEAQEQIRLLKRHDYTLKGLEFRIKIGGKGCGGFTYETGFSEKLPDDVILTQEDIIILMDPFTAHYTQEASLDYKLDPTADEDGFILDNHAGQKYAGKFFKDSTLLPPDLSEKRS